MNGIFNPTWFDHVNQFLDAAGKKRGSLLDPPDIPRIKFCEGHVVEEWEIETRDALARYLRDPSLENLVEVADGIGDTIYVLCQLARSLGIPLNACFSAIHAANIPGKLFEDGTLHCNPTTGKVLKPPGWKPPDLWEVLKAHQDWEAIQRKKVGSENWTGNAVNEVKEKVGSWSNTDEVMNKHLGNSGTSDDPNQ